MRWQTSVGIAIGAGLGSLLALRAVRARRAIDFAGRTVVIFGGSRGLGLALARAFSAEGAYLVLVARDEDELNRAVADIEAHGGQSHAISCDVRNRGQIERTIQRIVHDRGGIDVLINDAGVIQVGPLANMTVADFEDAMATHFWGPLFTILTALPHMRTGGARRIVNISSIGGKIAVPHLQQQRVFAFVGNPFKGKTIGDPVGFRIGKMRDFPVQRISDLIDQVFLFFGGPFPRAVMADGLPQIGKALGDLRVGRPVARLFTLAQGGFQSRWR